MALTCNIDARGRVARLICGMLTFAIGLGVAWGWALHSGSAVRWVVAGSCLFGGAVMMFEARAGWCVVRAMGVKTPM